MKSYRILLVGGGTGGHITPLVAVAEQLKILPAPSDSTLEIEMLGDTSLLKESARSLGVRSHSILAPKVRSYASILNILDFFKFPIGFFQSLFHVWRFMPDVVFAKGGYASLLPVLIAKLFLIPVLLHDSDAIPGKTNIFLGKFADTVFLASPAAISYFYSQKIQVVGNPIRSEIVQSSTIPPAQARQSFQLDHTLPTLLITGASQGAQPINDIILLALPQLVAKYQIIHQCGPNNLTGLQKSIDDIVKEEANEHGEQIKARYRLFGTLDTHQMANAYAASDVVISRAGSTIYECAILGKPTILIPLPHAASDHQMANAKELEKFGGVIIEQSNLTPHILLNEIDQCMMRKEEITQKIKQFSQSDAAEKIAQTLMSFGS